MKVLVTGATGFVGRVLCETLRARGHVVIRALRSVTRGTGAGEGDVVVGEIDGGTDWAAALAGVDVVVHLAARVHVMRDGAAGEPEHFRVNAAGTARLAESAYAAGVRRVVFLSSIKVNGEGRERPYGETDVPAPVDPYGRSKLEAERALVAAAAVAGAEAVVIRPPLVYGPGVRGNFLRLLGLVYRGLPLPLGSIRNRRSLVSVWNLCDLVLVCLSHPAAPGHVFFAADDVDVSTPELIRLLASSMRRQPRLLAVPPIMLRTVLTLLGRQGEFDRLAESLCVQRSGTRDRLGWAPPLTLQQGVKRTVDWYVASRRAGES